MLKKYLWLSLLWICGTSFLNGQNTVGVISMDPEAIADGYNLIYPHNQSSVYLLDNCGRIVHQWSDDEDWRPGNSAFILPNGNLVRCKRPSVPINDPIWAGGGGAVVEILDWDNKLLHQFEQNDSLYRLHHDIAPMPNGNILMVVWEYRSFEESIAAGRDAAKMSQGKVWSEVIWEWDPIQDSIVWEWKAWDHLIQDHDVTKANYGQVEDFPQKIDLNYDTHEGHPDWLHINAIDYNPVLDQFVISVPYFDEIWVVDHSISTEEAQGEAGDLLYRFGNPLAYRKGAVTDQKLFFQHDIHWVNPMASPDDPDFGEMAVFNNRVNPNYSTAHTFFSLEPGTSEYTLQGEVFSPSEFAQTFFHPDTLATTLSTGLSSIQRLPNGNTLILSGRWGFAYELNADQEIVWEYVIPIKAGQPVDQGTELMINNNITFRMDRYPSDFAGFVDQDLSPGIFLEKNPIAQNCPLIVSTKPSLRLSEKIKFYPNPNAGHIVFEKPLRKKVSVQIINLQGQVLQAYNLPSGQQHLNLKPLSPGVYILKMEEQVEKLIIH